ncbi:DUF2341 domain-containing protein [Cohnella fermenti]|uniref:DUF2341 domain-containing protein n=1 Tax=Cohnella fermenti TaxID=2565925 RepID=A0A4V3WEQ8_9BACL|nr:DUF2341 domain-containing protein [Cohnella fermenti]THF77319.1 DUF2341 domain-containing protein [Cohnella fermenti]
MFKRSKLCLLLAALAAVPFVPAPWAGEVPAAYAERLSGSVGYLNGDSSPTGGSLGSFGYSAAAAFDYFGRSVGIDLQTIQSFNEIRLIDDDRTNRVNRSTDLSVYTSNDNVTYAPLTGWSFDKTGNSIVLRDFSATARYVKVHSNFSDAGSTNVWMKQANLQNLLEVLDTGPEPGTLSGSVGYLNDDRNPASGAIGNWSSTGAAALDYQYRSIGVDLGAAVSFNTVELKEASGPSRIEKADLSLYVSNDNATFAKVTDFDFLKLNNRIVLYNFSATARYIKVHNHFDDAAFTFSGSNLQQMLSAANRPAGQWTAGGGGSWAYKKAISVSNGGAQLLEDRAVYVTKAAIGASALQAAGKLGYDYADVRFADSAGRELAFEMDDNGFYVRVPSLAAGGSGTIWLYYGNPSASFTGGGQEALQVEYGNKTLEDHTTTPFKDNAKPVLLADGDLMMVANRVQSTTSGIYAKYSEDGGRTWTTPVEIMNLNNAGRDEPAGLFVDPDNGDVLLFFYSYYGYTTTDCLNACRSDLYMARSTDNGQTFQTPAQIDTGTLVYDGVTYPVKYNVTYADPIQLANGDWVLPFAYVKDPDGGFAVSVVYSTDKGATWQRSASQLSVAASGGEGGLSEPSIIQLTDGTLQMYMRQQVATKVRLAESVSTDNGRTWSTPVDANMFSSNTKSVLTRHSNGDVLLLWPGNNAFGGTSYIRNPLTLAYSKDETASWNAMRDLLGRTRLSGPAVNADTISRPATQPSTVMIDSDTYLFGWWGTNLSTAQTLLVEDFNRYLYKSHGVSDDFEYEELKNDYWWQLGSTIAVSHNQARSGAGSLRLLDDNTTNLTAGSRLFPGMRQGIVKFSLYAHSLGDSFSFSLREPYSYVHAAEGTMFQFFVETDGSLKVYNSAGSRVELPVATDLTLDAWHDIELRFDATAGTIAVYVDGVSKGTAGTYKSGNLITHFNIASSSTPATGTDVYIDDLTIRNTELGLPTAGTVGTEQSA